MKKYFITVLIIFLFAFTGCKNALIMDFKDSQKEYALVTMNIQNLNDSEGNLNSNRTILPVPDSVNSDFEYVLEGNLVGESKKTLKTWSKYSDLANDFVSVKVGVWDFSLIAYKKEDDIKKIYAVSKLDAITIDNDSSNLSFYMDYSYNTLNKGDFSLKVKVPYHEVEYALISLYYYDYYTDAKNNVSLSSTKYIPAGGSAGNYSSFTVSQTDLPKKDYFLQMDFYTKYKSTEIMTATRLQHIRIEGGRKSEGEVTYDKLNNRYEIVFHSNLPSGEAYTIPADKYYNESNKIVLPDSTECYANHYDFAGWYDNPSCSGTPITGWAAGDKKGSINLYSKWNEKQYTAHFYDYAGGQVSGKVITGPMADKLVGYNVTKADLEDAINGGYIPINRLTENEISFVDWYTDAACTKPFTKITDSILYDSNGDSGNDSLNLYAKWKYKNVYLDPVNGNDSNRGYDSTEPLKTMAEARLYISDLLEAGDNSNHLYLLDTLTIATSLDADILSNLTTPIYKNMQVVRHDSFATGNMINITSSNAVIENVIFNGNSIDVGGTGSSTVNTTGSNIQLKNCKIINGVFRGDNSAGLTVTGGDIALDTVAIINNTGKNDYSAAGVLISGNAIYQMKNGEISNNRLKKTDPSVNFKYAPGVTVLDCQEYSYLSNVKVVDNISESNVGAIYIGSGTLQLDNIVVKDNIASTDVYVQSMRSFSEFGSLAISGKSYINKINVYDSVIYPRDYYQISALTKNPSTLTKNTAYSANYVADVFISSSLPVNEYNALDPSTYYKLLDVLAGDALNDTYKLFNLTNSGYIIRNNGLVCQHEEEIAGGGAITNPFGDKLEFRLDSTSLTIGEAHIIEVKAYINDLEVLPEDFATKFNPVYTIESYGIDVTEFTVGTDKNTITIPSSYGYGLYELIITGVYRGIGFNATCEFTIE